MAFIKRTKQDVLGTKPLAFGGKTKSGRKTKDGVQVTFNDGSSTTLLTPSGKRTKYFEELKDGVKKTNDLTKVKTDKKGRPLRLRDVDRAYRNGYIQAQNDAAAAFKAKGGKNSGGKTSKGGAK